MHGCVCLIYDVYVKNSVRHFCVGVVSHFAQYILLFFFLFFFFGGGGGGGGGLLYCNSIFFSLLGWGFYSYLSRKAESKINSYIL